MTFRVLLRMRTILRAVAPFLVLVALVALLVLPGASSTNAAESAAASQCMACHTDAAKLKALTPPDPPAAETGEG
jgi:mono/diheme cytochrome c family protein